MRRYLSICMIFACISLTVMHAQSAKQYDVTSGLSSNVIKGIVQDKYGYIWFATSDGLNFFNGSRFQSYACSYRQHSNDAVSTLNITALALHKDRRKIWAVSHNSSLVLFDPDKETFKIISLKNPDTEGQQPDLCYSLTYDSEGLLWIGTNAGIYIYDELNEKFRTLSTDNSNLSSNTILSIYCDSNNNIWAGGENGLYRFNSSNESFTLINPETSIKGDALNITTIQESPSGRIWIGTWEQGIYLLNKDTYKLSRIHPGGDNSVLQNMRIRSILPDGHEYLWLCTNVGLFKYDILHNRLHHITLSASQYSDNVYSSLKDNEGGIWIGTFFHGAYYFSPKALQILSYTPQNSGKWLRGSAISSFCEDTRGNIYISSENGGLSMYNPSSNRFNNTFPHTAGENIHALCLNGDELYVGTFTNGLKLINLKTGKSETFDSGTSGLNNNIFSLFHDGCRTLYIGTNGGCMAFDVKDKTFTHMDKLNGKFIYDIQKDSHGDIWFACYYDGIYRYSPPQRLWINYRNAPNDESSLPSDKTTSINIDDHNELWICTEGGGVCKYDYEHDKFSKFTLRQDGRPIKISIIYEILHDLTGNLWLSSNNGIYVCNSDGDIIRHLTHEDGLQSNQYNFCAGFRSSSGKLYFGGINGFDVISPESIQNCNTRPTASVRINYTDKHGHTHSSAKIFKTDKFIVPREINSFSIDFECLSYFAPAKNIYAYQIDDKEWTVTDKPFATFADFPTGKHIFRVKACNGDGTWSENEALLYINNLPPISGSIGAKVLYVVLVFSLFVIAAITLDKKRKRDAEANLNTIKAEQERETYQAKINFFTHIAHEIKTPVTLIKAPLEVIINSEKDKNKMHNLMIVYKNTQRLLNLVNQLLDFKKISSDGHEISMTRAYPQDLIENVTSRFDRSTLGNITLATSFPKERICCMLDPEAYTKIVSNLMTNAVKYASSHINVAVKVTTDGLKETLHLDVTDDGCGIPEEKHKKIFETFYQISMPQNPVMHSVGLGLSLVKLLVQKHGGSVYIDNEYKDGCRVCVDVPFIKYVPQENSSNQANEAANPFELKLLIVEDTADMLTFISSIFGDNHEVYKADNGKTALEILEKHEIDLVISDISMPVMDGFELLQTIRKNDSLCHLPFIMLTVEGSTETRIKGLEYGADAYIEKPFSTAHLLATVNNLIQRREAIRKKLLISPFKKGTDVIVSSKDKEWFENVTRFIQDNIQDYEIPIESIAAQMHMSRSSFQRKIKGLTGLSPVEFIRHIRLQKAAALLNTGDYRINEVSYMVGFNKPSYFSALFKKQFGVLPKDFKG